MQPADQPPRAEPAPAANDLVGWPHRAIEIDPGHVRAHAHYTAMLAELRAQQK